jgi:hypothetical protein
MPPRRARKVSALGLTQHRELFLHQASQAEGRSQLYADLCRRLADDPRAGELIESPPRWDAALRLLAGLHSLVLQGRADWNDIDAALDREADFLRAYVSGVEIQTNEVQRAWALLPCFLELARWSAAQAFDLIELGTSAGLLLLWDRYRYRYAAGEWGPQDAALDLTGEERSPVPGELLRVVPRVRRRVGIDRNPLDLRDPADLLLLKSFVWAGRDDRLARLDAAAEALRDDPPELVRGDLVELLPNELERYDDGALTVVLNSATLGYVDEAGQRAVRDALEQAGAEGPLAYLTTTQPATGSHSYWALAIELWPGSRRREIAYADFHGAWLEWRA